MYGATGGAAVGAGIGQLAGRSTQATLIGAAIGAALGGAGGATYGHMMDKQEQDMRQAVGQSGSATVQRQGDLLSVSLKGDVSFDTNSATVRPALYSEIDRIAKVLQDYPNTVIMIEGHTDSRGSDALNMELSRRRAEAVKSLFVQRGIDPRRLEVVAYGASRPIASNDTDSGRQMNRRVEIKIAPNTQQQQPTDTGARQ
ncbi:MAG: OmpA family protein [Desulfobacteraceae bacterium]|nr:OmpA family protein [Desulfobacteraceae bacterium]